MRAHARVANAMLTGSAVLLAATAALMLGPTLETKFFPVYSKFEILELTAQPEGKTRAVFAYTKLRSCEPVGVNWFMGEPGAAYRQVELMSLNPPTTSSNRPVGFNVTVPYLIDVTPDVLRHRAFATIYSNCHPFWVTQSRIYP